MEKKPTSPFFLAKFSHASPWIFGYHGSVETPSHHRHQTREEGLLEAAKCSPPVPLAVDGVVNGKMFPPSLRICFQHEDFEFFLSFFGGKAIGYERICFSTQFVNCHQVWFGWFRAVVCSCFLPSEIGNCWNHQSLVVEKPFADLRWNFHSDSSQGVTPTFPWDSWLYPQGPSGFLFQMEKKHSYPRSIGVFQI